MRVAIFEKNYKLEGGETHLDILTLDRPVKMANWNKKHESKFFSSKTLVAAPSQTNASLLFQLILK